MTQTGGLAEGLASVAAAEIGYWDDAAEAILTDAIAEDGDGSLRLEALAGPEVARALLHPSVDLAGPDGTCVVVRSPRVRHAWITHFVHTGATAQLRLHFIYAGLRWVQDAATGVVLAGERDTDRSLTAQEYWGYSEEWTLHCGDGSWQLEQAESGTLADALGYQYLVRPESADEFSRRTGIAPPTSTPSSSTPSSSTPSSSIPSVRRFLIVADAVDDDVRYGNSTSIIVELASPPSRQRAWDLILPSVLADMRRSRGDLVFQPRLQRLEAHELLD